MATAARALALATALGVALPASAQAPFATPTAAADALIRAVATSDTAALSQVLGSNWRQLVPLDRIDRNDVDRFLAKAHQSTRVDLSGRRGTVVVGDDPWSLPIPLAQGKDDRWRFDPVAAREEIAIRRIGANERAAMQATLAYVDAQREYATADRNGDGVLEYAQKLVSSPGRRDGLIWSASLGDDSPLGEGFLPRAPGEGYHGYRFRILTAQGSNARGGARSYLIGNRMTSGFALLAWPVKYGETGVMSFTVSQDGEVYERDLGPQTAQAAAAITRFDPDERWRRLRP
jgi:hypothetical protein